MVAKDYNHPSVVMYSIGNEISETALPKGNEYNKKLVEKVRALDASRPVINAINFLLNAMRYLGFGFFGSEPKKKKKGDTEKKAIAGSTGSAWTNSVLNFFRQDQRLDGALACR